MTRQAAGRIRRLSPAVVAKIAAGEMILRPVSVAKELLENALDAGAARITIEIREAADRFLSLSDDGCGMSEEECLLAIERHATSKIHEEEDLVGVRTLGFRGEALASIARVARVRVVTSDDGLEGSELRARGGDLEPIRPAARDRGTTVEVEDLFFNSPVRKRFLRSPAGEIRLIQKLISSYAIPRPEVDFRLVVDGKEGLRLVPTDPEGRLEQIHGPRFREKVLPLCGEHPRVRIGGWVGIPEIARSTTQGQTVIVNGRPVSHPPLAHALRQGFGDLIAPARHPFAVLILEIAGGSVDVNIHPTKREVRFLDETIVFAEVARAVREATRRLVPGIARGEGGWSERAVGMVGEGRRSPAPFSRLDEARATQARIDGCDLLYRRCEPRTGEETVAPPPAGAPDWEGEEDRDDRAPLVPVWQVQNRYVVAQTRQGLLIVDQHAAHERILYERALRYLAGDRPTSQQLLFPVVVELSGEEGEILGTLLDELPRLGIHLESFGGDTVILRAVPATWEGDPTTILRELLEDLAERTRRHEERAQALAACYACHSAIRSGTKLDAESMNRLIDELFSTGTPHGDPHGRPTYVVLTVEDLDRRFGRSG